MNENKLKQIKIAIIVAAALFMLGLLFSKPVMVQQQDYHQFVDTRTMLGIPNALDVLSNIFFALTGLIGVMEVMKQSTTLVTKKSWWWFFVSIILIAPGSAYYHWSPNDATLVWDRLPMSLAFMALYILLLSEHLDFKIEKYLYLALFTGLASVFTWVITTDLRFYYWVQFSSFITTPLILFMFPSRYTLKGYYGVTLVLYGLAKWAEVKDREIFAGTGELFSGHTLKHALAAFGLLALWWMVKTRKRSELETSTLGLVGDTAR